MRAVTLIFLAAGCGHPDVIPVDDYSPRFASAVCQRTRECALGEFERSFFGMGDCVSTYEAILDDLVTANNDADCKYDEDQAAAAYANMLDMDCGDFYEGKYLEDQEDVWKCGGGQLPPTLTGYGS